MKHPTIQNLYNTFSKYQLNDRITGHYCPNCMNEEYNKFLHYTPLERLSAHNFIGYLTSVDIIDESCNDFKYFLPRLLEIIYESENQGNSFFDSIWSVVAKANYHSWKDDEKNVVDNFFNAYWTKTKNLGDQDRINWTIEDLEEVGFIDFKSAD